jgi:hypothetical protein
MVLKETKVTQEYIAEMYKGREKPVGKPLIESCSNSVVLFAEYMLGFPLRAWQIDFLTRIERAVHGDSTDRKFLALTSRQIGKTASISVFALWSCMFNKLPGGIFNSTQVAVISISDEHAKKVVREMKKLVRLGDKHMSSYKDDEGKSIFGKEFFSSLVSDGKGDPNNTTTITFKDYNESMHGLLLKDSKQGSFIKSFPPTGAILGNTYSLILIDEAGRSEKITDTVYYDYIVPTADEMDAVTIITSTPWVLSGFFYRMSNPHDDYEDVVGLDKCLFTIEAIKVELPDRYERILKQINGMILDGKKDEVDRAYYCRFVKGEQTYFDPKKVFDVFREEYEAVEQYSGECDMGVDFGGQVTSRSAITITAMNDDGKIRRLYHRAYEPNKDLRMLEDIEDLLKRFNVQRIIPDDCLDKDTLVLMAEGHRKKISDIKAGEFVLSYNFKTKEYESKKVLKSVDKGLLPTKEIRFRNGTSVFATDSHEWFTISRNTGKVRVKSTKSLNNKLEYIPQAIEFNDCGNSRIPFIVYAKAYLTGMYIAEGHRRPTKKAFFISQLKEDMREKIKFHLSKTDWVWQENKKGFYISDNKDYFDLWDAVGKGAQNKVIPEHIFVNWSRDELFGLYNGLIEGDGYIRKAGTDKRGYDYDTSIVYCTSSEQLAKDVKLLGNFISRPSTIYSRVHSGFGSDKVQYEVVWQSNGSLTKGRTNIKEIVDGGVRHVWDIKVEDNESFILADSGVITHNCPGGNHFILKMLEKGWNVHPMNFKSEKVKKYGSFRASLNRGEVLSYKDDDLKTEMLALEFNHGQRNSYIQAAAGYRDDLIDSFVMSSYFFVQDDMSFKYWDLNEVDDSESVYD